MMPPTDPVEPLTGDVVPYPGSALNLGAGKWLLATGLVVTNPRGRRVDLTPQTLAYWERVALKGQGKPLSELMKNSSAVKKKKKSANRKPLTAGAIEELRRKGYNQSQIADMHGVSRQAVSWHKVEYGGYLTTRQIVNKAWPWKTTNLHSKSKLFQRLRDHGEFMATGGKGMSEDKISRLRSFYKRLRDENVVIEFDPEIPPEPGISPYGGFALRKRRESDEDLLIRVNEHTNLTEESRRFWRFPLQIP